LLGGSGGDLAFPIPGQQFVQSGGRMIGNTAQHVGKPSLRLDTVEFRRADQGVDCRPTPSDRAATRSKRQASA